jgi:multidrug efflux pump subunit AcrA (membrane-fusion protein)
MNLEEEKQSAEVVRRSDATALQELVDLRARAGRVIRELEHSMSLLDLTATRAGTIVYPADYAGQKRKLGDSIYRADVILRVVGLGAMTGRGHVQEIDVARVSVRQPVTLRIDALPDATLHGAVTRIASSVQTWAVGKVVQLDVAIDPTSAALRPGMSFRGQIEIARVPGTILVPAEAVFVRPDGPVAYRETGRGLERVHLELGRRSAEAIEVVSGLGAGDRVSRVDPERDPDGEAP